MYKIVQYLLSYINSITNFTYTKIKQQTNKQQITKLSFYNIVIGTYIVYNYRKKKTCQIR